MQIIKKQPDRGRDDVKLFITLSQTIALLLFAIPQVAEAYIGPGAGISVIGTVIALFGAILLAIVGFIWYPIKRFRAKKKKQQPANQETPDS